MPLHAVNQDLLEGRLAKLSIQDLPEEGLKLPMSAVYLTARPPGPAGRWLIERLKQCSGQRAVDSQVAQPYAPRRSAAVAHPIGESLTKAR